jgi:hypothetical protein
MADTYREYLVEKIARNVMNEIAGYYQVSAKYPQVRQDVKEAIMKVLLEEDIE